MIRAKVLYHATSKEKAASILVEGLKPKSSFISLSHYPDSWKGFGDTILSINIEGLDDVRMTAFPMDETDEVLVWYHVISPDRISVYKGEEMIKTYPNDCCGICRYAGWDYYFLKDTEQSLICLRDDMKKAKKVKEDGLCDKFSRVKAGGADV